MKLAVAASGALGLKCMQALPSFVQLVCVLTDSDSTTIISWCESNGIPVYKGNPRNGKAAGFINQFSVDVFFSINYIFIIEKDIISWPALYALNIHGSLLPKYRGRTPHVWAIINGEQRTGFTIHLVDEGCDTGAIVYQQAVEITSEMTGADVLSYFNEQYPAAIGEVLKLAASGKLQPVAQNENEASWFGKRTPEDGKINWSWPGEKVYNWVRAQAKPYPGAFSIYKGKRVVIHKVSFSGKAEVTNPPGTIIGVADEKPIVQVADGTVALEEFESSLPVTFIKGERFHA